MALKPLTRYSGQISTADPTGYPHGAAQNIIVEGDGIGTPWEKDLVNDLFGLQQALLSEAGLSPTNVPDKVGASQYLDAIKAVSNHAYAAKNWRIEYEDQLSGENAFANTIVRCSSHSDGTVSLLSSDGEVRWTSGFGIDFAVDSLLLKAGAITDSVDLVYGVDNLSVEYLVLVDSLGQCWKSDNYGLTRDAAGTVATGITRLGYSAALGLFFAVGVNKIYTSPDLTTWTSRTVPGGWSGITPERVIAGPDAVVMVPIAADVEGSVLVSTDGITWTIRATDNAHGVSHAEYSAVYDKWIVLSATGTTTHFDLSDSSTIGSLTEISSIVDTEVNGDLAAIGYTWVLARKSGMWISTDNGVTWARQRVPGLDTALVKYYHRLLQNDGRVLAFQSYEPVTGQDRLRVISSGRI